MDSKETTHLISLSSSEKGISGLIFCCFASSMFLQNECETLSILFWKHFTTMNNAVSVSSYVIHLSVSNSCLCLECKLLRTGTYHTGTMPCRVGSCSESGTPVHSRNIMEQFRNAQNVRNSVISHLECCTLQMMYVIKLYVHIRVKRILSAEQMSIRDLNSMSRKKGKIYWKRQDLGIITYAPVNTFKVILWSCHTMTKNGDFSMGKIIFCSVPSSSPSLAPLLCSLPFSVLVQVN